MNNSSARRPQKLIYGRPLSQKGKAINEQSKEYARYGKE